MLLLSIDCAGCVDNPHFSNMDEPGKKSGWAALVYRQGSSVKIAAFLPKNKKGTKIDVAGLQKGLYVVFGASDGSQKFRSLYVVKMIAAAEVSFQSVGECDIPTIYEIDIAGSYSFYLLKAKQAMLEAQMNDIGKWVLEFEESKVRHRP